MEATSERAGYDIVVVGASAGGVEALRDVVASLPANLGAAVFVVLHLPPSGTSVLPQILTRAGSLRAVHAVDSQPFEHGCIYIAPPDRHMRFSDGRISLDAGPKENGHRPAVDPMFRSAAATFGSRVVGVILSGVLDDGAAGLVAVKDAGGAALVQSPADALYPTMPKAAIDAVGDSDVTGTASELAAAIVELTTGPPLRPRPTAVPSAPRPTAVPSVPRPAAVPSAPSNVESLVEIEREGSDDPQPGAPSGFTCPECHGALWETQEGNVARFRCRTGHEFSSAGLLADQSEHIERALWTALRALEEKAAMLRRLSARFTARGHPRVSARLERRANRALEDALAVRALVRHLEPVGDDLDEAVAVDS